MSCRSAYFPSRLSAAQRRRDRGRAARRSRPRRAAGRPRRSRRGTVFRHRPASRSRLSQGGVPSQPHRLSCFAYLDACIPVDPTYGRMPTPSRIRHQIATGHSTFDADAWADLSRSCHALGYPVALISAVAARLGHAGAAAGSAVDRRGEGQAGWCRHPSAEHGDHFTASPPRRGRVPVRREHRRLIADRLERSPEIFAPLCLTRAGEAADTERRRHYPTLAR